VSSIHCAKYSGVCFCNLSIRLWFGSSKLLQYLLILTRISNSHKNIIATVQHFILFLKILKVIKKQFACNGTIVNDEKAGGVIQLQGDQRNVVKDFLVDKEKGLEIDPKTIKVHGF